MRWVMYRRPLAGVFEFAFGGIGFSLSSCVHRVRLSCGSGFGRIAAWQRRTGKSACATERRKERCRIARQAFVMCAACELGRRLKPTLLKCVHELKV
jgi:hypothetical protein